MMISASTVKELRERTGCGMMDCKKALTETNGDMDKAIEFLREKGLAAAVKKAGRIASEGLVDILVDGNVGAMVEVNSETDFVAKNAEFQQFVKDVAKQVIATNPADVEALLDSKFVDGDNTIREMLTEKIATIGENMNVRRFERFEGNVVGYVHGGGRIGVMVLAEGALDDAGHEAARDAAMQIAAINPLYLDKDVVPAEDIEKEKAIIIAQIKEDPKNANKPDNIIEKMVGGKINKFFEQNCLNQQAFVKDDSMSVSKYLESKGVKLTKYARFEKGEGLEKKVDDFAAEVASMTK
ncbi:MAG: elongation factor Ts [Clostridia bacterium]|nr:elongation factor Ts [Oscillospiraceae bacterium]MBQ7032420.1 elongation factor Ts [Clostridia bacterium]